MPTLKAGRIYKDVLRVVIGTHTEHFIARRLWLARCDADPLTDERID